MVAAMTNPPAWLALLTEQEMAPQVVVLRCPFCGVETAVSRATRYDIVTCRHCDGEYPIDLGVRWSD